MRRGNIILGICDRFSCSLGFVVKKYIQTREGAEAVGRLIAEKPIGEYGFCVEIIDQAYTPQQRKAIYVYCTLLSTALNDAGFEIEKKFLGKEISCPWSKDSVKQEIWNPVMLTETGKTSITKLKRKEVSAIYEILARFFTSRFGIFVPFPADEPPMVT